MPSELQSAERTLRVLELLGSRPGATLSELGRAANLPLATAHRMVRMLTEKGYVRREAEGRRYWLTGKMLRVGAMGYSERGLLELAGPALEELRDATNETAHLAVLMGGRAVIIASLEGGDRFRVCSPLGACDPLHCTAIGKVLAAFHEPPLMPKTLKRFTSKTIVDKRKLLMEMENVRQSGVGFDREESTMGVRCIAAPVFNRDGRCVAAIGISGPAERMAEREDLSVKAVIRGAKRLSDALRSI